MSSPRTGSGRRVRAKGEEQRLKQAADRIQLYQLQGNLAFSTTEVVIREVREHLEQVECVIFDLKRVLTINESACYLFHELLLLLSSHGTQTLFTHSGHLPLLGRYLRRKLGASFERTFLAFPDNDHALEWSENYILRQGAGNPSTGLDESLSLSQAQSQASRSPEYMAFAGLTDEECALIRSRLTRRAFEQGETLVRAGDAANEMFFLAQGSVSVVLGGNSTPERRLASFSAGMNFGEMALLDRAPRSARVVDDEAGICEVLAREDLEALEREHPGLMVKVLRNLCLALSARLRKANAELVVLD